MYGQLPGTVELVQMVVWGVGSYLLGAAVFRKNKNKIMQRI